MENKHSKNHGHGGHHETVNIHIDRKVYHDVKNPITGAELYQLAGIQPGYDLFKETKGQGDDVFIANNNEEIHLHPGDHFYTAQNSLNPGAN